MQTILIVEDNIELRENTSELLQLAGYSVISTSSEKESVKRSIKSKPDLILCDLADAHTGSIELLMRKKSTAVPAGTPLVFLCEDQANTQLNGYKPDALLGKPFTYEQLLHTIRQCLSRN
jgi:CheY-like chemotaxis protein